MGLFGSTIGKIPGLHGIGKGLDRAGNAVLGAAPAAGGALGTVAGGMLGGPAGALAGGALGGMAGNAVGSFAPRPGSGGSGILNKLGGLSNKSFGDIAQGAQNSIAGGINKFLGPEAQQAGLGQAFTQAGSNWLGNQFGHMAPQGWQNMSAAGLAQQGMDQFHQQFPGFGGNGPGFGEQAMNYMNNMMPQEFQQAGVGNALQNAGANWLQNRMGMGQPMMQQPMGGQQMPYGMQHYKRGGWVRPHRDLASIAARMIKD